MSRGGQMSLSHGQPQAEMVSNLQRPTKPLETQTQPPQELERDRPPKRRKTTADSQAIQTTEVQSPKKKLASAFFPSEEEQLRNQSFPIEDRRVKASDDRNGAENAHHIRVLAAPQHALSGERLSPSTMTSNVGIQDDAK